MLNEFHGINALHVLAFIACVMLVICDICVACASMASVILVNQLSMNWLQPSIDYFVEDVSSCVGQAEINLISQKSKMTGDDESDVLSQNVAATHPSKGARGFVHEKMNKA